MDRSGQIHSPEAWEAIRDIFTTLYLDEGRKLEDVRTILRKEHNFAATARQYKRRIKDWNLYKTNTRSGARVLPSDDTGEAGESSTSADAIAPVILPISSRHVVSRQLNAAIPWRRRALPRDAMDLRVAQLRRVALMHQLQGATLPAALRAPGHLKSIEIAVGEIREFYLRAFNEVVDREQVRTQPASWGLRQFYELANSLSACANIWRPEEVLNVYNQAIEQLELALKDANPLTLVCLLQVCARFLQDEQIGWLQCLLRRLRILTKGSRLAPLSGLCESYLQAIESMPQLVVLSAKLALTSSHDHLGAEHPQTLSAARGAHSALIATGDYAGALESFLPTASTELQLARERGDLVIGLEAAFRVLSCHLSLNQLDEAERQISTIESTMKVVPVEAADWRLQMWYRRAKGEILRLRRNPEAIPALESALVLAREKCETRQWWIVVHAEKHLQCARDSALPGAIIRPFLLPS